MGDFSSGLPIVDRVWTAGRIEAPGDPTAPQLFSVVPATVFEDVVYDAQGVGSRAEHLAQSSAWPAAYRLQQASVAFCAMDRSELEGREPPWGRVASPLPQHERCYSAARHREAEQGHEGMLWDRPDERGWR